jgi:hypothetical protein
MCCSSSAWLFPPESPNSLAVWGNPARERSAAQVSRMTEGVLELRVRLPPSTPSRHAARPPCFNLPLPQLPARVRHSSFDDKVARREAGSVRRKCGQRRRNGLRLSTQRNTPRPMPANRRACVPPPPRNNSFVQWRPGANRSAVFFRENSLARPSPTS